MRYALLVYGDPASAAASVESATTVRVGVVGSEVSDGPATPANDALEAVAVLDAPSLDDAIEWAERLRRDVTVEIRPVVDR